MRNLLTVLLLTFPASTIAQTLPLEDGAYLRNPQWCEKYFRNDLDFIEFEVEQEGRSFGFIEVGCLVHSVKKVRDARYWIEADCIEAGENYQRRMFLDINSDKSIRIDGGELHHFCQSQEQASTFSKAAESPKDKLTRRFKAELLIPRWHKSNERCRGGSGDDPNTEKACIERDGYAGKLHTVDWCYGRENQSGNQYEWHACEATSIRQ